MHTGQEGREDRISRRAHDLWLEEGRPDGRADTHWHQAVGEIDVESEREAAGDLTPKADEPKLSQV